jgi:hypothetical protein
LAIGGHLGQITRKYEFFKHSFLLYGQEKKDEYGHDAANNLGFIVLKSVGPT